MADLARALSAEVAAGLAYLHGRIVFRVNPSARPAGHQSDAWLEAYLHEPGSRSWLPVSNFTPAYGLRLRRALEAGRADTLFRRGRPTYLLRLDRSDLRARLTELEHRLARIQRHDRQAGRLDAVPGYVLAEYLTPPYELRVALVRGTPAAGRALWSLYHGPGDDELEFAAAARAELLAFQQRVLASLPLTAPLRRALLERWRRLLPSATYRAAAGALGRLAPQAHGPAAARLVQRLVGATRSAQADLLRARLLAALFRAADEARVPYLAQRPLRKTMRASQAARIVRANLTRLGLPLRRPDEPPANGWSVDLSPHASASIIVQPEQRRVLLQELPGDPRLFSPQDLYLDLGLHELSHILRAEAGRRGPLAILATGVRGSLDYEEGLAALLERLAVSERRTTRRESHALGYYAANLAVQTRAGGRQARRRVPRYSWQEIYDLCGQFGAPRDELYETIRRLVRMTDGRRRSRNVNLRDATYYRGVKRLEAWLTREVARRLVRSGRRATIPRPTVAQTILDVLNELMVGKVTPDFAATLRRHGHREPPPFVLALR